MQDAISAPAVGGIVRLTRFILRGTFLVELVGALALLPAFCRDYGLRGVWMAVFHSISAFCNAGFDILGRAGTLELLPTDGRPLSQLPDGVCRRPAGEYRHYAADRRGRHRLSDMG